MRLLLLTLTFTLYAAALHTTGQLFGVFRPDMDNTNVEVARLLPQDDVEISPGGKKMRVKARPGTAFEIVFKCNEEGTNLIFTEGSGYKWVGCCPPGTKLMGNDTTAFDCCDGGEDVTGCSATKKYQCCPSGWVFDGNDCARIDDNHPCHPPPPCPRDQSRGPDGKCVFPCLPGQIINSEGWCTCPLGTKFSEDDGTCQPGPCPIDRIRINGHCVFPCPAGQVLDSGECVCAPGTEKSADDKTCQTKCPAGSTLIRMPDGTCRNPCPDGQEYLDEICIPKCAAGLNRCGNHECCQPCPEGYILDEKQGECVLVVCPAGTERSSTTNLCVEVPPKGCSSGIQTGKCYTLTFENGQAFGYDSASKFYTASSSHQFGKFQICTNENCTPGVDIEAGTYLHIQEVYGLPPPTSGKKRRIFINNAKDGAYMTRTREFWESAGFVVTKWPGGKHCLGGYRYDDLTPSAGAGVGLTFEEGSVGATMLTEDDQACVVMTLNEVPCDIRAEAANCVASSPSADGKAVVNASMPSDGSGVSRIDLAFDLP